MYDADPRRGPAVAAGMLAPTAEANFGEEALQELMLESMRRWPGFAAELAAATGMPLGYRTEGTLLVALTEDDLTEVRRLVDYYRRAGTPIEPLGGRRLRELRTDAQPARSAAAPGPRAIIRSTRGCCWRRCGACRSGTSRRTSPTRPACGTM